MSWIIYIVIRVLIGWCCTRVWRLGRISGSLIISWRPRFGGHKIIIVVIPVNTNGAEGGALRLDEPLVPLSGLGGQSLGGIKSSSSSQVTQDGAAGGRVRLDEPPVRWSGLGGHGLGGMKSSWSSSRLTEVHDAGGAVWLDELPDLCSCGRKVVLPDDLRHLLRLVWDIGPPKINTNLRKLGIDLLINSVSSGKSLHINTE